jgi:hypothetical protein
LTGAPRVALSAFHDFIRVKDLFLQRQCHGKLSFTVKIPLTHKTAIPNFRVKKRGYYQKRTTCFIERGQIMRYKNIVSVFSKRLFCVIFVVVVMCSIAPAVFAAWDSYQGRYNPDSDGMVVGYDTPDCKGNSYILLYHGTTYNNLANWHGADGSQFNDKISCVIIGKHTFFEHWNDAYYKGVTGV